MLDGFSHGLIAAGHKRHEQRPTPILTPAPSVRLAVNQLINPALITLPIDMCQSCHKLKLETPS